MPFTSIRSQNLAADARRALEQDETIFVCHLKWGFGMLGDVKAEQSGWIPEIGACIAAVENEGWQLDQLTDGTTDGLRVVMCLFRRSLR